MLAGHIQLHWSLLISRDSLRGLFDLILHLCRRPITLITVCAAALLGASPIGSFARSRGELLVYCAREIHDLPVFVLLSRFGNLLLGRGFRTDAEYYQDRDRQFREQAAQRAASSDLLKPRGIVRSPRPAALYTVQCMACGKKFKRSSFTDTPLKPHKSPTGLPCDYTIGLLR